MVYQKMTVLSNDLVVPGYYRMVLNAGNAAKESEAGQFVMMKSWTGVEPFLMRPISINSADKENGTMTFLYKVVGKGTELLSQAAAGSDVQVLGPVGHGFPLKPEMKRIAIIGRGIGIAPILYLAEEAVRRGMEVYAYLSAKTDDQLFCKKEMEAIGVKVRTSTSADCMVTDLLAEDLKTLKFDAGFSCGSKRLMGQLHRYGKEYGFETYVSLEERMGCGIGACKGCIVATHDADGKQIYETVCQCGPVFPTERIV